MGPQFDVISNTKDAPQQANFDQDHMIFILMEEVSNNTGNEG